jgi:hypothetical protein
MENNPYIIELRNRQIENYARRAAYLHEIGAEIPPFTPEKETKTSPIFAICVIILHFALGLSICFI